jgi:uncharacterized RDD family membrane protein YckC
VRIDRIARNLLANEAEHAIDAALAGPLPEAVARSLAERRVLERVLAEVIAVDDGLDPELDPAERFVDRLARNEELKRVGEVLANRLVHSEEFERILADALASPAVRRALGHAMAHQATGFGADTAATVRRSSSRVDDAVESGAHRLVLRARTTDLQRRYGGVASRLGAFAVDILLGQVVFLVWAATVALIGSLAGFGHPGAAAAGGAGGGALLVYALYFVGFWYAAGQTPGLRLMNLRVVRPDGRTPGVVRGLVRYVGLLLSIAPAFLGFLPMFFDPRRRGLADYLAGTVVLREADE